MTKPDFWRHKSLTEMSPSEWESLCDGCAKCCLHKLEDEDSGEVHYTNVVCHLLDLDICRCTRYAERTRLVPDCLHLTPEMIGTLSWLPATCAYRLVDEGKDLPSWHPLLAGDPNTVHEAGVSVRSWAVSEQEVDADDIEDHVIQWQI